MHVFIIKYTITWLFFVEHITAFNCELISFSSHLSLLAARQSEMNLKRQFVTFKIWSLTVNYNKWKVEGRKLKQQKDYYPVCCRLHKVSIKRWASRCCSEKLKVKLWLQWWNLVWGLHGADRQPLWYLLLCSWWTPQDLFVFIHVPQF